MEASAVVFLAALALVLVADHLVIWRRFTAASQVSPARARRRLWQAWMGMLWLLAGLVVVLWSSSGRSWRLLGLHLPTGWRAGASAALILAVIALYAPTIAKLRRVSAERKAALYTRLQSHACMLPHTRGDLAWFLALSVTAGICEELVFRGYLLWAGQSLWGLWPAVVASCVVFALAHAYQGISGIVRTGVIGALFMAAFLSLQSLAPVMVAHALIDVGQGIVSWLIVRGYGPSPAYVHGAAAMENVQA